MTTQGAILPIPARLPHRHSIADPDCRAAVIAEARRSLADAQRLANTLELGGEVLEDELRLVTSVMERLAARIRELEGIRGHRSR